MLFSVIIPTYNRASFLARTLDSVLAQDFQDFEVIVVDDGSTDHTQEVVALYTQRNQRIRYFYKDNGERAAARNFGIRQAQGSYVTFLDSDDLYYPHCLSAAHAFLQQHQNCAWFALAYEIRDENGQLLSSQAKRKGNLAEQLFAGNLLSCIAVFVRRDIALLHPFQEDRTLAGSEDWELWLRLAARYPLPYANEVVACMIQHDARSVMKVDATRLEARLHACMRYVEADEAVRTLPSSYLRRFRTHAYAYLALHLALGKHFKKALHYYLKALRLSALFFFDKKSAVILRELLKGMLWR
jgi:glycosyltransferase involved in cell wall biosynthesis